MLVWHTGLDKHLVYFCVVDINGFLIAHCRDYRKDITGDDERDLPGNRRRIFDDPVSIDFHIAGSDIFRVL